MSHVAAIDICISDDPSGMTALRNACAELGLTFIPGKKTFEWYGAVLGPERDDDAASKHGFRVEDYGKCEHAIQMPGCAYEIGVVKRPDGKGFTLCYDHWGPSPGSPYYREKGACGTMLKDLLGQGCEKLRQLYGVNKATLAAKARGYMVQRKPQPDGAIKLQITGC